MDEKWCYGVVLRNNNNKIKNQDVTVSPIKIHHKQHRNKVTCVCVVAFLPSQCNNIEKGGNTIKVSLVRAGRQVEAKKDTYKRQYYNNRYCHIKYHYPKEEDHKLRSKGNLYFQDLEVTGSAKGEANDPKFDLLSHHRTVIFPRLQEIIREEEKEKRGLEVKVVYQMDGAGCHTDSKFEIYLKSFMQRNGWVYFKHPSQSPATNVLDACVFPSLSKRITQEQGKMKGGGQLEGEDLWEVTQNTWGHQVLQGQL